MKLNRCERMDTVINNFGMAFAARIEMESPEEGRQPQRGWLPSEDLEWIAGIAAQNRIHA